MFLCSQDVLVEQVIDFQGNPFRFVKGANKDQNRVIPEF